ncbi:MAG: DegV family protein [Candidatus Kariarchaeaceae archaeon]|jgi:DegV family protein with EDD domain
MTKVGFFTDTASDILQFPDIGKEMDIRVIYQNINIGDEQFSDENLTLDQLLDKMNSATKETWPKTSQPSVGQFLEKYEQFKEEGYTDVISVHVASKMSGTMNSARLASEQIEGMNVHLIDAQMASLGILPTLMKTHELIKAGVEPAEIATQMNKYALENEVFAAVPQLDNLYNGGRLKPIRYRLGKLLRFKPVLKLAQGEISSHDKTKNVSDTQTKIYEYAVAPYSKDDDFELIEVAERFKARFETEFPGKKVHVGRIGPSMAVHLGPQGLAIGVYRK